MSVNNSDVATLLISENEEIVVECKKILVLFDNALINELNRMKISSYCADVQRLAVQEFELSS